MSDPARPGARDLLRRLVHGSPATPEIQRAFGVWSDDIVGRASPSLLLFFLVVVVVWWPTDALLYGGRPREMWALAGVRTTIIVVHVFWLTVGRRALRARPALWGTLIAIGETWFISWQSGRMGGLDSPWAYYIYILPLISVALVRPLWDRTLRVVVLSAGCLIAVIAASETPIDHPHLPSTVSYFAFCTFFCILVGHGVWLLLRENFVQQQLIEEQRAQLDGFNRQLEQRVAEQTRDLQVLSQRLETLREKERAWMAREMHDALGQELTAARYALDLVRTRLSGDDARLDGALVDVQQRVAMAHGSVRRILQRLRPRVLDELGLPAALGWLARDAIESAGLAATVSAAPDDIRLAPDVEIALYRVAQEAVSNALRHARARAIALELTVTDERIRLAVTDDGVGMHSAAVRTSAGVGCIGIRERVSALGGRARWEAPVAGGTRLVVELPRETPC